jgi:tRNA-specific 2-thiouridylase
MLVGGINLVKFDSITDGMEVNAKIRYKDSGAPAEIFNDGKNIRAEFLREVKGVAPGQSAVFYDGNDLVGGGIIQKSFNL